MKFIRYLLFDFGRGILRNKVLLLTPVVLASVVFLDFLGRYSGFENLNMLSGIRKACGAEQVRNGICAVGLDPADKKKYRKYSLGMKQRLGIAAAIMEEPDIVILDEPTNALDESGVNLVKDILLRQKERGALVIVSCHDIGILKELSDEIFKMEEGRIVEHFCLDDES